MMRLGDLEKGQPYAIKEEGYRRGDEKKGKERKIGVVGRRLGIGEEHCSAGE